MRQVAYAVDAFISVPGADMCLVLFSSLPDSVWGFLTKLDSRGDVYLAGACGVPDIRLHCSA